MYRSKHKCLNGMVSGPLGIVTVEHCIWNVQRNECQYECVWVSERSMLGVSGGEVKVATVEAVETVDNMATLPVSRAHPPAIDVNPEKNNFTNKEMEAKKRPTTAPPLQPKRYKQTVHLGLFGRLAGETLFAMEDVYLKNYYSTVS